MGAKRAQIQNQLPFWVNIATALGRPDDELSDYSDADPAPVEELKLEAELVMSGVFRFGTSLSDLDPYVIYCTSHMDELMNIKSLASKLLKTSLIF